QLARVAFNPSSLPDEFGPDPKGSLPARARPGSEAAALPRAATQTPLPLEVTGRTESSPGIETPAVAPAGPAPKRPSVNPFARKRSIWPALVGLGLLIGAVVAFFSFAPSRTAGAPPASSVAAPEPTPPKQAGAGAVSRLPSSPAQSLNACVRSYFADETFAPAAQLEFVCEPGDHRNTTNKLYELSEAKADLEAARLAAQAANARPDEPDGGFQVDTVMGDAGGGRIRRPLGWYELLSTAVVRKGCCPNAAPVTLPETTGWCEQLQDVVRDLADDSARSGDLAPRVKRFDKAVDCLFANRVRRPYNEYKTVPLTPENRAAFQKFLSHAAVSDAQRRTLLP
ncbi:MAG TPA: hypothetical protein VFU02_12005, partial [Polyangiaceae bacterium]|nr:hypothetical protein [Polyangiaceae bacterium]